jgi:hypothetical protein
MWESLTAIKTSAERARPMRRFIWILAIALLLGTGQARQGWEKGQTRQTGVKPIPAAEFARILKEFSEEEGFFRSDNWVSNETSYLHIVDKLRELGASGGAYIGVGPEQNFTYIAKIRPAIAFIVDIRRQAMIQHLMFKALFHLAENRTRFLSYLFSKPIVGAKAPGPDASAEDLVSYFSRIATDREAYVRNLRQISNTITRSFRVPLGEKDRVSLETVYATFRDENLNLQYRSYGFRGVNGYGFRGRSTWSYFPPLRDLILASDLHGQFGSFLASRSDYEFVRSLQESNRIIPLVGDFAGAKALSAVAVYLRKNGYAVTAFYTSNVEQYLFSNRTFDGFVKNVSRLPITQNSLFIRAYPNQRLPHPAQIGNHLLTTLLQKMTVFLDDYRKGLYPDYWSLVSTHYIAAAER